jgi:alpha-glucosidase
MKKFVIVGILILTPSFVKAAAQVYTLNSPDGKIKVKLSSGEQLAYELRFKNSAVLIPSAISMTIAQFNRPKQGSLKDLTDLTLGQRGTVKNVKTVKGKGFNEIRINFSGHFAVLFRAYNEGFAYRFETDFKDSVVVKSELASFNLQGSPAAILQETDKYTSWEGPYLSYASTTGIADGKMATTPALFNYTNNGIKVVVAEADQFSYPGMFIKKSGNQYLGEWAAYPTKTVMGSWGDFVSVVKERASFLAKTSGKRTYPWRVVIVTDDDKTLLNNHLVAKLAKPTVPKDFSWVKPGKAAWEWWHDAMLPGAAIPSGMANRNTALYNYYVDFAAENKLEYVMIDAGWSNNYDVTKVNPKLDVLEVISRAKEKKVGVFLWCVASTVMKDLNKSLDFIKSTGAVGIKVDFFDRDDQLAMEWMEEIAKATSDRHLMVDFHGCTKPTGMEVTYPNVVNYEAVRGSESDKWDYTIDPDHHLLMPFIRMLAGPFDYTPGAMRNKTKAAFKPIDPGLPSGQGTRAHELAMYVIYDQPLAMLSDAPTAYMKYPDVMKYLSAVPTVYDQTKVLSAKLAAYAMMAKRKDKDWYVGAMTNWTPRNLKLNFDFLSPGILYTADIYQDGKHADVNAEEYEHQTVPVTSKTKMNLILAAGGGAAIMIKQSPLIPH